MTPWLNYHHLLYFWAVARRGSVSRAAEELRLAQPTLSGQIRVLEEALGEKLFRRVGRGLALTEVGQVAFGYADEIFSLGRELHEVVRGQEAGRPLRLAVGIADVVPELLAHHLLERVMRLPQGVRLVCHDDKPERLYAELAVRGLDVVLSDRPLPPTLNVRAFSHLLGECGVAILGTKTLVAGRARGFPKTLDGAPFVLPTEGSALRRSLDRFFEAEGLHPRVEGEIADSALQKTFAQAGAGLIAVPDVVEAKVRERYGLRIVGRLSAVRQRFFAVTLERRLRHPAVVALAEAARNEIFERAESPVTT